jgi:hypothetical protein
MCIYIYIYIYIYIKLGLCKFGYFGSVREFRFGTRVFRVLTNKNRTRNRNRSVREVRFGSRVVRFGFGNSVFRAQGYTKASYLPKPNAGENSRQRCRLLPLSSHARSTHACCRRPIYKYLAAWGLRPCRKHFVVGHAKKLELPDALASTARLKLGPWALHVVSSGRHGICGSAGSW